MDKNVMPSRLITIFLITSLVFVAMLVVSVDQTRAQTQPSSSKKAALYACPMHPEVTSTKPGVCPKCDMKLKLVTDTDNSETKSGETSLGAPTDGSDILFLKIPDIKVYDQFGKPKNFYTDLVKDKTVAINFIFTTCTTICPPMTATFRAVQKEIAKQGLDVQLISVSVDPTTDTSERLLEYASKFKAEPGWTFVTGDQASIDSILRALGAAVADKNDHSPMVLIGNEGTGFWTRANGLTSSAALVKIITQAVSQK